MQTTLWISLAVVGGLVLAGSVLGARHPTIHPLEARAFHAVNGLPDWLYVPLWLPMQLGNLVVGTLVGLAIAWWAGDWRMAVGVVAAMGLKLLAERLVRKWMAGYLSVRQRPGTSETGAKLRGKDVPSSGMSFPSGHIILVAGIAAVVGNDLPGVLSPWPFVLTLLVMLGRVYVGAHNPLDVTAGLGAGLLVGAALDLVLGL
ncbi:MAG: phosphatase PAP2 family protein [Acidimicrobiales bacterium]|jgi:undecaprenyl-diphosphatase|nr:phosphatase PAP2 family protein [Acidimicrobiales bacterium]